MIAPPARHLSAGVRHVGSPVFWYISQNGPGRNPLAQPLALVVDHAPDEVVYSV